MLTEKQDNSKKMYRVETSTKVKQRTQYSTPHELQQLNINDTATSIITSIHMFWKHKGGKRGQHLPTGALLVSSNRPV